MKKNGLSREVMVWHRGFWKAVARTSAAATQRRTDVAPFRAVGAAAPYPARALQRASGDPFHLESVLKALLAIEKTAGAWTGFDRFFQY
jgi:hypothetical protein